MAGKNPEWSKKRGNNFTEHLNRTSLVINKLQIAGSTDKPVSVQYYQDGLLAGREGQFFVSMPEKLASLSPGSYIPPENFLAELGGHSENGMDPTTLLLSDYFCNGYRMPLNAESAGFSLTVFHGMTNSLALEIADIATDLSFNKYNARDRSLAKLSYKTMLAQIMAPVLKSPDRGDSPNAVRIVEDSIATGNTLAGVLAVLSEKTSINELLNVRIDAGVASAQGILLLRKFCKDNGLNLELNVAYMGFGLSKGKSTPGYGYEHANIIHFPGGMLAKLEDMYGHGFGERLKGKFLVGDIGSVSTDEDGIISINPWKMVEGEPEIVPGQYPVTVFLARGGILMRAYLHSVLGREAMNL